MQRDGYTYEGLLRSGALMVIPAGKPSYWRCRGGELFDQSVQDLKSIIKSARLHSEA